MAANTIVLIIVAAMAALVLAGMIAGVTYKTRNQQRLVIGETPADQAKESAWHVRQQEALADEYAVKAHAAQVEVDIKTARVCRLQREAALHRGDATICRDQLNEQTRLSDKLTVAAPTP